MSHKSYLRILQVGLTYGWPIGLSLLLTLATIVHIAASPEWRTNYLFSSDSVTLALFIKSLLSGEPLRWIFSSQIFFFPEAVIYVVSYLFTQSTYGSLILNSLLNGLILYGLFYWINKQLFGTRLKSQFWSVVGVALICGFSCLELQPAINQNTFVTLYFFNTYYYGIVLASLSIIALTITLLTSKSLRTKKIIASVTVIIVALTAMSNPLLMLQFTLPYLIVVTLLFFINRLPGRMAILLIGIQAVGLVIAQLLRIPFKDMVGLSANSYININNIPSALHDLRHTISLILVHKGSIIEYAILGAITLFAMGYGVWLLYKAFRNRAKEQSVTFLLVLFAGTSPFIIVFTVLLTGNAYTRYFLPIAFFPLIGLFTWASQCVYTLPRRIVVIITSSIALVSLIFIGCMLPHTQPLTHATNRDSITCFTNSVGNRTVNAVGSFWSSRQLDLYSDNTKIRVLQVNNQLTPYPWMNNRALYARIFDTVIVDKTTPTNANVGNQHVAQLGQPDHIWECRDFFIYQYDKNNPGYWSLNQRIHS